MGTPAILLLLLALPEGIFGPIGASLSPATPLDLGYWQMYNLEFKAAHQTFKAYQQAHPDDPLGHTSEGAAFLFEEFNRLGILQTELFVDDEKFRGREKRVPDPAARENFNRAIARSNQLAQSALKRSPNDANAHLATVMNLGMESDYLALVEKRDLAALSYTKRAGVAANQLLAVNPNCYDAYLAVGVENYILGLKPAPVRWLLQVYGAHTDKELGIQKLELTAEKGHFLLPFARFLLAVAALRDKNPKRARELLQNLALEFPNNDVYRKELERLQ